MAAITFAVSPDVPPAKRQEHVNYSQKLRTALRRPIEAIWRPQCPLVQCDEDNALLAAIQLAFYYHCPLRLSPDVIWITLARGFALHVNLHAEELRGRFVEHAGQKKLTVSRPDFFPGKDNPWPEVFDEFADKIGENTGGLDELVRANFTTTGPTERAISSLMAMETFQAYFEYLLYAGCGIPTITLTGMVADWQDLRRRAGRFADYGLENWLAALDPILAQFVSASEGNPNVDFWKSLFRYHSGSGPAVMTGWAHVLFPYFKDSSQRLYPNPYLQDWRQRLEKDDQQNWRQRADDPQGIGLSAIPSSLTAVPLTVFWGDRKSEMRLVGGLMGVSQDAAFTLQPECGWAIVYDQPVDPLSPLHERLGPKEQSSLDAL